MKSETTDKLSIAGKNIAIGTGIAGACAVVVSGLCWFADGVHFESQYSDARKAIKNEERYEEDEHNLVRLEQRLGESCITLINDYLPGGRLAYREEDSVVTDLIENPAQPCGDDRTETRINFSELLTARDEFDASKQKAENSQKTVKEFAAAEEEHESDQDFDGINVGFRVGGGIGVLIGVLVAGVLAFDDLDKKGYLPSQKRKQPLDEEEDDSTDAMMKRFAERNDRST